MGDRRGRRLLRNVERVAFSAVLAVLDCPPPSATASHAGAPTAFPSARPGSAPR